VLCASGTEPAGRTVGYHAGIDGFVQSPIDVPELHALLQALLRRAGVKPRLVNASPAEPENEALTVGSLVIHEQNRSVSLDSQPLALTPTQYRAPGPARQTAQCAGPTGRAYPERVELRARRRRHIVDRHADGSVTWSAA
jgi:hypothetical protein